MQELIAHDPNRPHIALLSKDAGCQGLRGHIDEGAHAVAILWIGILFLYYSEICDPYPPFSDQYVCWFQISVNEPCLKKTHIARIKLCEEFRQLVLCKPYSVL